MRKKIPIVRTFLLCLLILGWSMSGFSQPVALLTGGEEVNLHSKQQKSLGALLSDLETQYEVNFNYASEVVKNKVVNAKEMNRQEALEEVLRQLLTPLGLKYEKLKEDVFFIVEKEKVEKLERQKIAPNTGSAHSDARPSENVYKKYVTGLRYGTDINFDKTITGNVTDENEEGLPGVNILVKETTIGTVTDVDGNYSLTVPDDATTLVFSSVGYLTEEVSINNQSVINQQMLPDIQALSEIVVVGYGTQRKADVTGAVAKVSTEKTADLPNYSVLQSIQGQVPGVNIASPERAGQDPNFIIRGVNSLTAGNSPLIVVDGIIYNGSISDFSANDITSVDILKDASAAAVYGSRAANGVLLFTTKTGKTDKPTFNFNTYVGFQQPDKLIAVDSGPEYEQKIADYNEILLANDPNASLIELTNVEQENKNNGMETDWIDESLRMGMMTNYHIDVSGQTDKTDYYISGSYFNQEGIVKNDNFDRLTLNLNLTNHITDWYSISVRSNFSNKDYSGVEANMDQAYRQSPYGTFYDEDGPGGYAFLPIGDALGEHPLIVTLIDDVDKRTSLRGLISSKLEVPFIPGLQWTLNYAGNIRENRFNRFFDNEATVQGQLQNGIARKENQRFYDWTLDNIVSYKKIFAEKHSLDLTLLFSREYREIEGTFAQSSNFVSQALGYNGLGLGEVQQVSSNLEEQNSIAQMARLNYNFDNRYAITATVRRDGFSAFAEGNKYATFPSVALAWTPTNEAFLQNSNWLNYLKVRASYGINGNQAIDRYSSLARIGTSQYLFGNDGTTITTFTFSSLGNDQLTWETTTAKNLGIDFEIFNNRISGAVDAYMSSTEDLLQSRRIPQVTGFESILTNIGEVENKGIEISVNTDNLVNAALSWKTGLAFSLNRNKIVSLGGVDADGDGVEDDDIANGWFIGETFDAIYGFKTEGIYQLNDDIISNAYQPGDFRIVDVNEDGNITPADRTILGTESPNFRLSMSNTLKYRQFSLYVLVNSVVGGGRENFYVGDNFDTRSVNRRGFTTFSQRFNLQDVPYWTPNNATNDYPRLDYTPPFDHPILEDRSFVRIQDISLAYNFSQSFLDNILLRKLRIYASIKNLHTFTKWSGYNPESQSTIRSLPFLRSYTLGIDFSF